MKTYFKTGVIVFFVIIFMLPLVSCSGFGIESHVVKDTSGFSEKLVWSCGNLSAEEEVKYIAYAEAFMKKYPGVKISLDFGDQEVKIESGDVGNVISIPSVNRYKEYLLTLNPYIEPLKNEYNINIENINPGAYMMGSVSNRLFGAPQQVFPLVLYANKKLLERANLEVPANDWTWEDFITDYAPKMKKQVEGVDVQQPMILPIDYPPVLMTFISGWGGFWYDENNIQVSLVNENVLRGIHELTNTIQSAYIQPDIKEFNSSDSMLSKKNYAFGLYTPGMDMDGIDWELVAFPLPPYLYIGTDAYFCSVYNRTDRPDLSAAFALYFLTEEGQRAYNSAGAFSVPAIASAAKEDYWVKDIYRGKNYDAFVSQAIFSNIGFFENKLDIFYSDELKKGFINAIVKYFEEPAVDLYEIYDVLYDVETKINETLKK